MIVFSRVMFDTVSVRISVFVGSYDNRLLSLDTNGDSSPRIWFTSANFRGISWVTKASLASLPIGDTAPSSPVSVGIGLSLTSADGMTLMIGPCGTTVKPWISRMDRKTWYASSMLTGSGAMSVTLPRTLSSTRKFLPVNSLIRRMTLRISTSRKFNCILLASSGAWAWTAVSSSSRRAARPASNPASTMPVSNKPSTPSLYERMGSSFSAQAATGYRIS